MKLIGFTSEIKGFDGENANISVKLEQFTKCSHIIALGYEAILKCMKDTNREAFYLAMASFVDDKEYDACKFLEGLHNE